MFFLHFGEIIADLLRCTKK